MFSSPRLPTRRSALIAIMLAALMLAQWLGVTHRVVHSHEAEAHAQVSQEHGLEALFGHDRGSACDLYDQLTHADTLPGVPASVLPVVAPMPVAIVHRAWHLAAQSTGFLARGPPSLS